MISADRRKKSTRPERQHFWRLFFLQKSTVVVLILLSCSTTSTTAMSVTTSTKSYLRFPTNIKGVMAPMVAASDYAFRCLCRQHGVDLTFTQMMHARNLVEDKTFPSTHLDFFEYNTHINPTTSGDLVLPPLQHASQEHFLGKTTRLSCLAPQGKEEFLKGPLIGQIAGSSVDNVLKAANTMMEHSNGQLDGLDLNLGCPQGIARKGNYGAFLSEYDFDNVCDILTHLSQWAEEHGEQGSSFGNAHHRPMISAKIRLPLSDKALEERIPRLVGTGISFLTIHGRTLLENKTKVRGCHVDRLRQAVELAHQQVADFPVIANGGIEYPQDVPQLLQQTGAVAVMSSEALLETPDIFQPSSSSNPQDEWTPREIFDRQYEFCTDYLDWCSYYPPLPGVLGKQGCATVVKGHMYKFLHRYLQEQPDIREELGCVSTLLDCRHVLEKLKQHYSDKSDADWMACKSSKPSSSWYRRHRDANRRVHEREIRIHSSFSPHADQEIIISVEEKKRLARERIAKLKAQRMMVQP